MKLTKNLASTLTFCAMDLQRWKITDYCLLFTILESRSRFFTINSFVLISAWFDADNNFRTAKETVAFEPKMLNFNLTSNISLELKFLFFFVKEISPHEIP
jgi:hypothetical protein